MTAQSGFANLMISRALTGGDARVATRSVFDGLDWHAAGARVEGSPHTLYELLHMVFWQDGALEWLHGGSPSMPQHASDRWSGASSPNSRAEWLRAARRFRTGLARLEHAARWPPPSGGLTW